MVQEIETQKMEALNALVQANLSVSDAKNKLVKLKEEEGAYLAEREEKALARIQSVLDESSEILMKIDTNYAEIKHIYQTVSSISAFLEESYTGLRGLRLLFDEKTQLWEAEIAKKEKNIEELKENLKVQTTFIENEKIALKNKEKSLKALERKLNDERGTLERAVARLKEGRI
jgi:paraquat-inducible protein B